MGLDADLLSDGYSGNLTVLRALQLRCGMTDRQAAAFCLVSPHTYARWGKDRDPNPTAVRLMAIMAGYVPWSGWADWEVHAGRLFAPGFSRHGLTAGDINAMHFKLQLLAEYERQVRAFNALADQAATSRDFPAEIKTVIGGGS